MTWERACRRVVAALAVALLLPALPAAAEAPPVEPEVRSVTTRWSGPLFIGLATLGLTNPLDSPADFTFALAGPAGWTWDVIEGRGDRTVEGVTAYEAWSATLLLSADLPLAGPARFAVRVNDGPAADIILPVDPRPAVAVLGPPCVAVVPGEAADLLFTVVNEGNAADPFTLAVASGRPDVSAALAGGPVSKPVGPDQPLPVVVRAVAGAGATVDPDVQIVLTATSGTDPTVVGRASACLAIAAAPELHLAVTPAEAVITPGETVLLAIDLLNRGNAPDSVRLGVRGLPAGWLASPGTDAVDLSPFSAGRSDIALRVPPGTPPQDVVLTVEGTSELGAAADDLLRVRVAPVRGLTILPEASLPVPPGGTARVPVTLINTGTLPETVLVVVAPPATWGPPSQMLVAVPAGGTVGTAVVVDIPGDYRIARAGAHTVALTASGLTGGAGASTATVIEVAAVHRLTAALPGAGVAVNPALTPETTVLLELANDGNGPEEVALTVSDGPADAVRLYQSFVPLQPGERRQVPIGLHLSPAVPPGILLVRIDAATDAVRLSLDLPVTVLDGDLAVRSFGLRTAGGPVYDTLPVAADRRDLVEVLLLVRNEGTAVIAGGVAEIEAGGTPIRRQELGPMAPGESVLLQFPWRPPPGTTELTAVVQAPGDSHPEDDTARASAAAAAPPPSAAPTVATGAVVGGLLLLWLAVEDQAPRRARRPPLHQDPEGGGARQLPPRPRLWIRRGEPRRAFHRHPAGPRRRQRGAGVPPRRPRARGVPRQRTGPPAPALLPEADARGAAGPPQRAPVPDGADPGDHPGAGPGHPRDRSPRAGPGPAGEPLDGPLPLPHPRRRRDPRLGTAARPDPALRGTGAGRAGGCGRWVRRRPVGATLPSPSPSLSPSPSPSPSPPLLPPPRAAARRPARARSPGGAASSAVPT